MLIFNSNARLAVIYNMPKRGKSQNLGTIKHTQAFLSWPSNQSDTKQTK